MTRVPVKDDTKPVPDSPSLVSQSTGSLLTSLVFWSVLICSGVIYASVALSPKIADWMMVRQQFVSNAQRLKVLEDEADYLERVVAALKKDPEFAARLARASSSPSAELTSVMTEEPGDVLPTEQSHAAATVLPPLVATAVLHLATHQRHRFWLLLTAGTLVLLGFTLLNDSGAEMVVLTIHSFAATGLAIIGRYRKHPEPPQSEISETDEE